MLSPRNDHINSSFKDLRKDYAFRKKFFTKNVHSAIDSTQEVHSGWLKARTTLKRWTKVWCQVKPGYLLLYTSQEAQKKHRMGVVLLYVCQVIKRPTKKEGFCFKLMNPFGCSVWAKTSSRTLVFSHSSLTLRASDDPVGKLWLDALNRCNLSANLDGFQPVIESDGTNDDSMMQINRDDLSNDSDGSMTRLQIEKMLSHSNTTSHSSSLSSLAINNHHQNVRGKQSNTNYAIENFSINGKNHVNGSCSSNALSSNRQNNQVNPGATHDQSLQGSGATSQPTGMLDNNINQIHPKTNDRINDNSGRSSPSRNAAQSKMVAKFNKYSWKELKLEHVSYLADDSEELGSSGVQGSEVQEGNKHFLWHIITQLRPGMDLSKVTLPTFILEPRSFLEKMADYYYHCDLLNDAIQIEDPVLRMTNIVKWYLSGFYKVPNGAKKPYNPILGEKFRCFWDSPRTNSRTFFIAEQVSHHPPVTAFHVSNRKDGYVINCSLLSRSKFGGNSVSAILDGKAKLHLINRNETYTISMPFANCRGILLGSLTMELGGKVEISCRETNCRCEIDFKLAPVWAGASSYNSLTGKIISDGQLFHTFEGHWDKKISMTDKRTNSKSTLWEVTDAIRKSRLTRYTVDIRDQGERESIRLWSKVTAAIKNNDQVTATTEKTILEDMQRREARERTGRHVPDHFVSASESISDWSYKWLDARPWNGVNDIMQFEDNFKIRTLILTPRDASSGPMNSSSLNNIPNFDPAIDLPLSQISRSTVISLNNNDNRTSQSTATTRDHENNHKAQIDGSVLDVSAFKSIESKIAAENEIIKKAIEQVSERNKKLEEDLARLKRGKRAAAFVMAAIMVALIAFVMKFYP